MPVLFKDSYGKADVRLTKVTRGDDGVHQLAEMTVAIDLQGEFSRCYTHGDNSSIIPTDTMKNTVYAIAKKYAFDSIEGYAKLLAGHFIEEFGHVSVATVAVQESLWNRIAVDGKPHEHAFVGGNSELRTCRVEVSRAGTKVQGGISGLTVLKTTKSGFVGYIKDQYTTLKETTDRIFATVVDATWNYVTDSEDFNTCYHAVRTAMLGEFAVHDSLAVQQTLYAMAEKALAAYKGIDEISLIMPNQHRLLINLQPFQMDNNNEIFVPTTEPFGRITGTIRRA